MDEFTKQQAQVMMKWNLLVLECIKLEKIRLRELQKLYTPYFLREK